MRFRTSLLAIVLVAILLIATVKRKQIESFDDTVRTPASDNFGIDVFKQEDLYSKSVLQTSLLNPSKNTADLLMAQQKQRQSILAFLNEKVERAQAKVDVARKEADKAANRLNLAKEKTKQVKDDLTIAEITLGFSIAQQAYAASNFATIDPTVAARAAGGVAAAAKALTTASINVDSLKKYKQKMSNEEQNFSSDLIEYNALAAVATTELTKATKEYNEALEFMNMSAESEYVRKKFFPFASAAAAQNKKECDDLVPRRG